VTDSPVTLDRYFGYYFEGSSLIEDRGSEHAKESADIAFDSDVPDEVRIGILREDGSLRIVTLGELRSTKP
jgi:hypothetical protein